MNKKKDVYLLIAPWDKDCPDVILYDLDNYNKLFDYGLKEPTPEDVKKSNPIIDFAGSLVDAFNYIDYNHDTLSLREVYYREPPHPLIAKLDNYLTKLKTEKDIILSDIYSYAIKRARETNDQDDIVSAAIYKSRMTALTDVITALEDLLKGNK